MRTRSSRRLRGIARHGKLKRYHPFVAVVKLLVSVVAVVAISAVSVGAIAAMNLVQGKKESVQLEGQEPSDIPDIGATEGGVNMLIVGTDTRLDQGDGFGDLDDSDGYGNADVTMLLHIAEDHQSATVVSIPRDLMGPIPQCPDPDGGYYSAMARQSFNTSLQYGGLPCTVLTAEELTGLDIPFAGVVSFNGVISMSNAVGGVPVCVSEGIYDYHTNLSLDPGEHMLKGEEALQFLRVRHGVGDGGDLSRISNQQVFLSSLVRTIKSAGTLGNPAKVWGLAKATMSNVTLSRSLDDLKTLYQIAMALKDVDLDHVTFVQYPVFEDPYNENKVIPDEESADILMDAIKADRPLEISGGLGAGSHLVGEDPAGEGDETESTDAPGDDESEGATDAPLDENGNPIEPTDDPNAPVVLPENIRGQTAVEETCSAGQG